NKPNHTVVSKSGNPDSIIVGICGANGRRSREVTANARTFPAAIIGRVVPGVLNVIVRRPAIKSTRIGGGPRYGTPWLSKLPLTFQSSPERGVTEPNPLCPKLTLPGAARA